MIGGTIARRYSKALFELAIEAGREEQVGLELEQFEAAYQQSELREVLINPAFGVDSRKRILARVAEAQRLSSLSTPFLCLLLERDRLPELPGIVSAYRRLVNEAKGRVEARAVSASPLEPAQLASLRQTLGAISGKEVVVHQETDPELVGGLWVELEGRVYDGTVKTQLEKMKQRIARGY